MRIVSVLSHGREECFKMRAKKHEYYRKRLLNFKSIKIKTLCL